MKAIFSALLLFGSMALCNAQQNGDTKVVVKTNASTEENFLKIGRTLNSTGYLVHKSDPVFKSVISKPVAYKIKRRTYKQIFLFAVDDDQIIITSWFKRSGKGKRLAEYQEGNPTEVAFEKMTELAESLDGEISYSK